MRLISAEFRNFKLLKHVRLEFSTDPSRPLTVIRAENGSGKTSVMYALLWGLYGSDGLPDRARGLRLTSSAHPAGEPVDIQVVVEFDHADDSAIVTRYRLLRTTTETPGAGDRVERTPDRLRLMRSTSAGDEDVEAAEAMIARVVPLRLRDVFFTNGDDIQTFISGRMSTQQRQAQVHKAIRELLGIERLQTATGDLEYVFKQARADAAKTAGADAQKANRALEDTDREIEDLKCKKELTSERLRNMTAERTRCDKELTALRGIGDIDDINKRLEGIRRDVQRAKDERARLLAAMKDSLRSEPLSWLFMISKLERGVAKLSEMADRRIIPGLSVEVLADRLELRECICGDSLEEGSPKREAVERLRAEQQNVSESRQRLTALLHTARHSTAIHTGDLELRGGFAGHRREVLRLFTQNSDILRSKQQEEVQLDDKRRQIDEERVRELDRRIAAIDAQIANANSEAGSIATELARLDALRERQYQRSREAEKAVTINTNLTTKRDVAEDVLGLARGTLAVLQNECVEEVSQRMKDLFMAIVGAQPGLFGVFTGVHIDKDFNIVVDTHNARQLDTDFELNGASQRALTLAFIWALMEVSGVTAPRIIDTPLGMVAGGVKTRMVDVISQPPRPNMPEFQVILMLTRSEVRDVEDLLDTRAGRISTLTCSKDYPEDLINDWNVDYPLVRACKCNHRQSCRVCARTYDSQHGIVYRDQEE